MRSKPSSSRRSSASTLGISMSLWRTHALYFTSFPKPGPRVSIKRLDLETLDVTVVRRDANGANGMTLDRAGRLIVCEQGSLTERARISRFDPVSGWIEGIVDGCDGRS